MKYEQLKDLSEDQFYRVTGITVKSFEKAVEILREAYRKRRVKGGPKGKLSVENRFALWLEFVKEYRTYFHIGHNFGITESGAYKIIKWVENTLIKHPDLALPGKKTLQKGHHETILIDATETPIERPKKVKDNSILGKRKDTPLRHKSL